VDWDVGARTTLTRHDERNTLPVIAKGSSCSGRFVWRARRLVSSQSSIQGGFHGPFDWAGAFCSPAGFTNTAIVDERLLFGPSREFEWMAHRIGSNATIMGWERCARTISLEGASVEARGCAHQVRGKKKHYLIAALLVATDVLWYGKENFMKIIHSFFMFLVTASAVVGAFGGCVSVDPDQSKSDSGPPDT
jgi:hypothetical protein